MSRQMRPSTHAWIVALWLALAWPSGALALDAVREPNLLGLPWGQILLSGAICLWGAMARTDQRRALAKDAGESFIVWREFLRDAVRSSVIGFAVFAVARMRGLDDWELALTLLITGYMGPAAIDLMVAKFKGGSGA